MSKVLIVDDAEEAVGVQVWILNRMGHTVDVCTCAKEALSQVHENVYDLMIIDKVMTDMSGMELCKILSEMKSHAKTPKILVTAFFEEGLVEYAKKMGFVDCFNKSKLTAIAMEMTYKKVFEKYVNIDTKVA